MIPEWEVANTQIPRNWQLGVLHLLFPFQDMQRATCGTPPEGWVVQGCQPNQFCGPPPWGEGRAAKVFRTFRASVGPERAHQKHNFNGKLTSNNRHHEDSWIEPKFRMGQGRWVKERCQNKGSVARDFTIWDVYVDPPRGEGEAMSPGAVGPIFWTPPPRERTVGLPKFGRETARPKLAHQKCSFGGEKSL